MPELRVPKNYREVYMAWVHIQVDPATVKIEEVILGNYVVGHGEWFPGVSGETAKLLFNREKVTVRGRVCWLSEIGDMFAGVA